MTVHLTSVLGAELSVRGLQAHTCEVDLLILDEFEIFVIDIQQKSSLTHTVRFWDVDYFPTFSAGKMVRIFFDGSHLELEKELEIAMTSRGCPLAIAPISRQHDCSMRQRTSD